MSDTQTTEETQATAVSIVAIPVLPGLERPTIWIRQNRHNLSNMSA